MTRFLEHIPIIKQCMVVFSWTISGTVYSTSLTVLKSFFPFLSLPTASLFKTLCYSSWDYCNDLPVIVWPLSNIFLSATLFYPSEKSKKQISLKCSFLDVQDKIQISHSNTRPVRCTSLFTWLRKFTTHQKFLAPTKLHGTRSKSIPPPVPSPCYFPDDTLSSSSISPASAPP